MIPFAFILMGTGGMLFGKSFSLSQRRFHGLEIRSAVLYNLRGTLQLLAVPILVAAVILLFLEAWWLGIIGIVIAFATPVWSTLPVILIDSELRAKLFRKDAHHDE
ncbi:MAG: hypothetical protein HN350_12440 [Phycisphaerales bacterium]|jgi:hypothetical protein|nr:hypothetical protein [Phycisphaerales bacterium]